MKVGEGNRAQGGGRATTDRRADKGEVDRKKEGRSFREMMENRGARTEERRGDERGRRLRDGQLQKSERDGRARMMDQRDGGQKSNELRARCSEAGEDGQRDIDKWSRDTVRSLDEQTALSSVENFELRHRGEVPPVIAQRSAAMQGSFNPALAEIARKIVQAVRVGEDSRARKVVFLDVAVPGRGEVRIRLRRQGAGMELRMRADNDALGRSLQEGLAELRRSCGQKGIHITSIQVAR